VYFCGLFREYTRKLARPSNTKNLEGRNDGLIEVPSSNFPSRTEKPQENPDRIDGVPVLGSYLGLNTKDECHGMPRL
jgi:hypothetical protein